MKQEQSAETHLLPGAAHGPWGRVDIVGLIPPLRAFVRGLAREPSEADDLVQETLLKAIVNAQQFSPGTNLKAWLFTIARNTFYTRYKKQRREVVLDEDYGAWSEPPQDWTIKIKSLHEALQHLPQNQREALVLVGGAGLSYEEAAQVCGCRLGTIKSRVNRGRTRLLELLSVQEPEDFIDSGQKTL